MKNPTKPRSHQPGDDLSGQLFEELKKKHRFTNDRQLANHFELHRSSVSRVRHGKGPVSLAMKMAIMSKDGLNIMEIERLIKQPRFKAQSMVPHSLENVS